MWIGLAGCPGDVLGADSRTGGEMKARQESRNSSMNSGGWWGDTARLHELYGVWSGAYISW